MNLKGLIFKSDDKDKKQFSVKEIMELTAREYGGSKFAEFID